MENVIIVNSFLSTKRLEIICYCIKRENYYIFELGEKLKEVLGMTYIF